jgi:hypothetical protein
MRWRTLVLVAVILVGLATAWIVILFGDRHSTVSAFPMPDGTWIQVEGATFGTNNTFTKGSPLLARLQKLAPPPLKKIFGTTFSTSFTSSDEKLVLWYNRYDPGTGAYPAPAIDTFRVVDEHGCVFHINSYGGGGGGPAYSVSSAYVDVFPRRQKNFKVRAQNFPLVTNIELMVENPFVTNPPAWKPEPFPVTRKQHDIEYTVERIRGHFYASGNWFETKCTIRENGVDRTEWYRPLIYLVDATGNRTYNALCPYEPAWKLEIDFYKGYKAPFPQDQIWRIRDVVVPKSGQIASLAQTGSIGGVSFKAIALCGSGDFTFSNNVCVVSNEWAADWQGGGSSSSFSSGSGRVEMTFRQKEPSLLLEIHGIKRSEDLLIRLKDDQGRTTGADFRGSANKIYRFDVKLTNDAQKVEIEFIPQKPVRMEYIVEPPRPQSKQPQSAF